MILGRITQLVKEQNWFAVGIELVILVLGVFLGIQLGNWNEERADRNKETRYLVQLIEDLRADLVEIDSVQRVAEIRMAVLEEILEFVSIEPRRTLTFDGSEVIFDRVPAFESKDPYEANNQLTNVPALDGSRHTFQALLSTGNFGLISDSVLAREIQTYYSAMDEANNLESAVHDHASAVHASRHRLGVSATGRVTTEQLGALAVSDPQFTAELETYWTVSAFQVRWMQGVRERTKTLIKAIETETAL